MEANKEYVKCKNCEIIAELMEDMTLKGNVNNDFYNFAAIF